MTSLEGLVNAIARRAWRASAGRYPPDCLEWLEDLIQRLRNDAARSRYAAACHAHADRLETEGRDRLLQFIEEYQIAEHLERQGVPLDSLQRNRIVTNRKGKYLARTDADVSRYPGALPFLDHAEWWRDRDAMLVVTSNPYADPSVLRAVCGPWAERRELRVDVRPELDFYSVGGTETPLVVWRRHPGAATAIARKGATP